MLVKSLLYEPSTCFHQFFLLLIDQKQKFLFNSSLDFPGVKNDFPQKSGWPYLTFNLDFKLFKINVSHAPMNSFLEKQLSTSVDLSLPYASFDMLHDYIQRILKVNLIWPLT